ncbi:hypothetical protein GCM10007989_27430 [Devosia pacifica]|uniref:Uncharacterized protein n=1 Tax=Devosia pacifica TaxID=1335967 RepID=A0A918VWM7_9HYPH|nr:hypothetical protein [Devosia pacifica]GHA30232.1 hypothetical protein GCM10007989_27430 [Devosia pacifica]
MSISKSQFMHSSLDGLIELEHGERQIALEYLADAWNMAEDDGVNTRSLAHASLFAALATFVRLYGDEATAELLHDLPDRIRTGEYNLDKILQ